MSDKGYYIASQSGEHEAALLEYQHACGNLERNKNRHQI